MRLGELLVKDGLLSREQVEQILERQRRTGEPFGLLCEKLAGVDPLRVEEAWAAQYATLTRQIDPRVEAFEERAVDLITRRQAWQFRVLPIRFDGAELMLAIINNPCPVIAEIDADSPAGKAGLREGDVIQEVNKQPVKNAKDLVAISKKLKANEKILLRVYSQGRSGYVALEAR